MYYINSNLEIYIFRYKGVLFNFTLDKSFFKGTVIVLAYGMPGSPLSVFDKLVIKLTKKGFGVAIPEYIGTFDSFGKFDFKNAVDSLIYTIDSIKNNRSYDLFTNKKISSKVKHIILIGGSFGGSIVLIAGAKSKFVDMIVAIAPVTDYSGKLNYENETGIDDLANQIHILQPVTWKVSDSAIKELKSGHIDINPILHVKDIAKKKVILIHGLNDKCVNYKRSLDLYYSLLFFNCDVKLNLIPKLGHIGISVLRKPKIYNSVLQDFYKL